MASSIGVAVWGTGNMGATAIRSLTAFPGLRLTAVLTSSDDKAGRDAATFAGLDAPTGIEATTEIYTRLTSSASSDVYKRQPFDLTMSNKV